MLPGRIFLPMRAVAASFERAHPSIRFVIDGEIEAADEAAAAETVLQAASDFRELKSIAACTRFDAAAPVEIEQGWS